MGDRTGVPWKKVNTATFTGETKKLHIAYAATVVKANKEAEALRDAIKAEWMKKHPSGDADGKVLAVKVSNGSVQYVMVDKDKGPKGGSGDDIL